MVYRFNSEKKRQEQHAPAVGALSELPVSLIERVELTEEKEIIIKFRFRKLGTISQGPSLTIVPQLW